jgi:hypothetical protein
LLCLFGELCWKDNNIFHEQVAVRGRTLEKWHALSVDGLHVSGLRDALAHQRDDVSIQMRQVPCKAKQGLGRGMGLQKKKHKHKIAKF